MTTEFGIFAEDGLLEGGFFSAEDAQKVLDGCYSPDDEAHVGACCHDHPQHEAATCEECNAEEEDGEVEVDDGDDDSL